MSEEKEAPKQTNITWETIEPARLPTLIDQTLEDSVLQDLATVNIASWRLPDVADSDKERRAGFVTLIQQATDRAVDRLRALQDILRDPTRPIPVDHRYEHTTGRLIIALDIPIPQDPTSERK